MENVVGALRGMYRDTIVNAETWFLWGGYQYYCGPILLAAMKIRQAVSIVKVGKVEAWGNNPKQRHQSPIS